MSKNYQRHYNNKTINANSQNKNYYMSSSNNSSNLYKDDKNTKDSNTQSKDIYEDSITDKIILIKKLIENKKKQNRHALQKPPQYTFKKPFNLKDPYDDKEESNFQYKITEPKVNENNKNYLYNNYIKNLEAYNGNNKKLTQKVLYATNGSNNTISISNDIKKSNKKSDISMKNLKTNTKSNLKISDCYQKIPYKKQLIHGNTPMTSTINTNRKIYIDQNLKEDNDNFPSNYKSSISKKHNKYTYRNTMKQLNTDNNNKNIINGSPFKINGNNIFNSYQKFFKFSDYHKTIQTKLINDFIFHLYNYFYLYYMRIIKIFFLGLKNNNNSQNYDSSYKRFNNYYPSRISTNSIGKADSFFTYIKGQYVLDNTLDSFNSQNRFVDTYTNKKFLQNSLESDILKEKIRSNNQSVSPSKRGESEMYRNINELNKKYETINNRKKMGLNISKTHRKIWNSIGDMNNSVDYERKSNVSANKKKFDETVEKMRQRSMNNKRKEDEFKNKKIAELHEKIMEKTKDINRLKNENNYNIINVNNYSSRNSEKNSNKNSKINIVNNNKIKEKKIIFDKKIIKNNSNMINIKNIVTADKKIWIHMNYLNCIYPRVWIGRRKTQREFLICKEFNTKILGKENPNKTRKRRLYNKLSEIKEEEEIKEELQYEIGKYNKYLNKHFKK